ncbi:MAG: hypothetical protein AAGF07_01415 [Patescibacteria group bacterium]
MESYNNFENSPYNKTFKQLDNLTESLELLNYSEKMARLVNQCKDVVGIMKQIYSHQEDDSTYYNVVLVLEILNKRVFTIDYLSDEQMVELISAIFEQSLGYFLFGTKQVDESKLLTLLPKERLGLEVKVKVESDSLAGLLEYFDSLWSEQSKQLSSTIEDRFTLDKFGQLLIRIAFTIRSIMQDNYLKYISSDLKLNSVFDAFQIPHGSNITDCYCHIAKLVIDVYTIIQEQNYSDNKLLSKIHNLKKIIDDYNLKGYLLNETVSETESEKYPISISDKLREDARNLSRNILAYQQANNSNLPRSVYLIVERVNAIANHLIGADLRSQEAIGSIIRSLSTFFKPTKHPGTALDIGLYLSTKSRINVLFSGIYEDELNPILATCVSDLKIELNKFQEDLIKQGLIRPKEKGDTWDG